MSNRMVETNFLTTLLELVQANLGVAIVPPFVKPMLPPDVVMRDLLAVPFIQTFYAMFSPTIEKGNLEQMRAYLNSAALDFS